MLSQTVEYALRAMVHLSYLAPDASSTDAVAASTQVPRAYLSKVLQSLRRSGLVKSQRGVGGGVSLAKPPEEITILEVVNAVEPIQRIKVCPLNIASHSGLLCPLHSKLDDALATLETTFSATTLAEIVATSPEGSMPLCDTSPRLTTLELPKP